ncbi:MAG: hypothetical protein HY055_11800 [Magnetospirillum sp.]|nr:hypothetical protein [Magnetospirillum sp.]
MRFPASPLGIFASICAVLLPAGAGLTAPVWLMVMGVRLDRAAEIGSRIVGVTVLACAALAGAYWLFLRPRIQASRALAPAAGPDLGRIDDPVRDRLVHAFVWILFLLPFVLIVVGFIVGQIDKVAGAD